LSRRESICLPAVPARGRFLKRRKVDCGRGAAAGARFIVVTVAVVPVVVLLGRERYLHPYEGGGRRGVRDPGGRFRRRSLSLLLLLPFFFLPLPPLLLLLRRRLFLPLPLQLQFQPSSFLPRGLPGDVLLLQHVPESTFGLEGIFLGDYGPGNG